MSTSKIVPVKDLRLDLANFRTTAQKNENAEIVALSVIAEDYFWGLAESLLTDGYIGTENIVVQKVVRKNESVLEVKEGNRRIAILKILLGLAKPKDLRIPDGLSEKIAKVSPAWKTANSQVPCLIFSESDNAKVDRIVSLTHGTAEKAKRKDWNSVAHARHNREKKKTKELGLCLLEAYLLKGTNLTPDQKRLWAGDYSLTVLDEALPKIAERFSISSEDLVSHYEKGTLKNKSKLDAVLLDIGLKTLGFPQIRGSEDVFETRYSLAPKKSSNAGATATGNPPQPSGRSTKSGPTITAAPLPTTGSKKFASVTALPWTDPKAITRWFKSFHPKGKGREKLMVLVDEARSMNIEKHPHAFCFLVRCMFEISAKLYCEDNKNVTGAPKTTKNGNDRNLKDILDEICKFQVGTPPDKTKQKQLHSAMVVLGNPNSILSVTSMNQLIHNPVFVTDAASIGKLFGNVSTLLLSMNE